MAKKLFEDTKWMIILLNNEKPVNGNESNLNKFFINYLLPEFWTRVQKKATHKGIQKLQQQARLVGQALKLAKPSLHITSNQNNFFQ